jgi:hypothetical protein
MPFEMIIVCYSGRGRDPVTVILHMLEFTAPLPHTNTTTTTLHTGWWQQPHLQRKSSPHPPPPPPPPLRKSTQEATTVLRTVPTPSQQRRGAPPCRAAAARVAAAMTAQRRRAQGRRDSIPLQQAPRPGRPGTPTRTLHAAEALRHHSRRQQHHGGSQHAGARCPGRVGGGGRLGGGGGAAVGDGAAALSALGGRRLRQELAGDGAGSGTFPGAPQRPAAPGDARPGKQAGSGRRLAGKRRGLPEARGHGCRAAARPQRRGASSGLHLVQQAGGGDDARGRRRPGLGEGARLDVCIVVGLGDDLGRAGRRRARSVKVQPQVWVWQAARAARSWGVHPGIGLGPATVREPPLYWVGSAQLWRGRLGAGAGRHLGGASSGAAAGLGRLDGGALVKEARQHAGQLAAGLRAARGAASGGRVRGGVWCCQGATAGRAAPEGRWRACKTPAAAPPEGPEPTPRSSSTCQLRQTSAPPPSLPRTSWYAL